MQFSIYGSSGFIGKNFTKSFPDHICIEREGRKPMTKDIIYMISTVDNYNIFDQITLDVDTNLRILCEVLDYCRNKEITFNLISSWFVYGKTDCLPADETMQCNPTGFYSITKKCAEDLLISFCHTFEVKYRILRLCNALGKGDKGVSSKKNAITWLINRLKENKPVDIYDNGTPVRDIMHIDDICYAIDLVCRKGEKNQIYNVGSGNPTTLSDIINNAKEKLHSKSAINYIETPTFHKIVQNKDFWMDTAKLQMLGFNPKHNLDSIISELCQ